MRTSQKTALLLGTVMTLSIGVMGCRSVARTCSGCCVSGYKDTVAGVEEGWVGGRERGASLDGAIVVFSFEDFAEYADLQVEKVAVSTHGSFGTEVTLVIDNVAEEPLRMADVELVALDAERFALDTDPKRTETTVPPKAKQRLKFRVKAAPKDIGTIRVWEHEIKIVESMRQHAVPTQPF